METEVNSTPKIQTFWISLIQAIFIVLVLVYLQPLLLKTGLDNYLDINQPPLTTGLILALVIEFLIIVGFPAYLVIKSRAWKTAINIVLLTVLWLVFFLALLLFS